MKTFESKYGIHDIVVINLQGTRVRGCSVYRVKFGGEFPTYDIRLPNSDLVLYDVPFQTLEDMNPHLTINDIDF